MTMRLLPPPPCLMILIHFGMKHETWSGGALADWRRWMDDFLDLAEEFDYGEEVEIRRLKKYTAKSEESSVI